MSLFGQAAAAPKQTGFSLFNTAAAAPAAGGGLFGATAAPQPSLGGTSLFGTPASTAAAPGGLFAGFQTTTAASTAAAPTTGLFGAPSTTSTAPAGGLFGAGATTGLAAPASTSVGLGGVSASTGVATSGQASAQSGAMTKPKDTAVPDEILALISGMKQTIKANKDASDSIATSELCGIDEVIDEIDTCRRFLATVAAGLANVARATTVAVEVSRNELRQGEIAQRRHEGVPTNVHRRHSIGDPLSHLHQITNEYELKLRTFGQEIVALERIVESNTTGGQTGDNYAAPQKQDVLDHLQRMDKEVRQACAQASAVDDLVEDTKDNVQRYRRFIYGASVPDPFPKRATSTTPAAAKRHDGPSPFGVTSNALLASHTSFTQQPYTAPVAGLPTSSLFGGGAALQQPQPSGTSLFGGASASSRGLFGGTTVSQPLSLFGGATPATSTAGASLFRPFGTAAQSAAAAQPTQPQLSFGGAAGTQSPLRFSTPFNNSSSGTLFGGTATNVGTVKPFGR